MKKKKDKKYCRVTKSQAKKIREWEFIWDLFVDMCDFWMIVIKGICYPLASLVMVFSLLSGLLMPVIIGICLASDNLTQNEWISGILCAWMIGCFICGHWVISDNYEEN